VERRAVSPSLSPEWRDKLLGPQGTTCAACGDSHVRHYCRSCDEFFEVCRCTTSAHLAHRIYLWTPERGVVAIPDFDHLFDAASPEHVHGFIAIAAPVRAPVGAPPGHTEFYLTICTCGAVSAFPAENYGLVDQAWRERFEADLAAKGFTWHP
jgi:hypothetical protein